MNIEDTASQGPQFAMSDWVERYTAGMRMVHKLLGLSCHSIREIETADQLIEVLNQLLHAKYTPVTESLSQSNFSLANRVAPLVDENSSYWLIHFNVFTVSGGFRSTRFGGVVFEDPIWAILTALGVGYQRTNIAVPKAKNADDMYGSIETLLLQVNTHEYDSTLYFDQFTGCVPPDTEYHFNLIRVTGAQVQALRCAGQWDFGSIRCQIEAIRLPAGQAPCV
jgi:hypothetical protein